MKRNNKLRSLILLTPLTSLSILPVISCSNSMEEKLENLLNQDNLFTVSLNREVIKNFYSNVNFESEKIKFEQLFKITDEFLIINESDSLKNWNSSLVDEDKKVFAVIPKLKTVVLPSINTEGIKKIESVDLIYDVASGHLSNKTINIAIDLTKYSFLDLEIGEKHNNSTSIDVSSINAEDGTFLKAFYNNVKEFLKSKNISFNNSEEISGKFEKITDTNVIYNYVYPQDDLYYHFSRKDNTYAYFYIYTSSSKMGTIQDIKTKTFNIELPFELVEISEDKYEKEIN